MTIKIIRKIKFGNAFGVIAEFTGDKNAGSDSGYPTGGYPLEPNQLGLHVVENMIAQSPTGNNFWEYDIANKKLKVLNIDHTDSVVKEVAAKTDLSKAVTRIVAFGW